MPKMKAKTNGHIEIEVHDGFVAKLAQEMADRLGELSEEIEALDTTRAALIEEQGRIAEGLMALRIS